MPAPGPTSIELFLAELTQGCVTQLLQPGHRMHGSTLPHSDITLAAVKSGTPCLLWWLQPQ